MVVQGIHCNGHKVIESLGRQIETYLRERTYTSKDDPYGPITNEFGRELTGYYFSWVAIVKELLSTRIYLRNKGGRDRIM